MGSPKQLLPFGGTTLLGHVLDSALKADIGPVFLVLGAHEAAVRRSVCDRQVRIIVNQDWALGQGASIAAGIAAIADAAPDAPGTMIVLADQPRISAALLREMVQRVADNPDRILAAGYAGTVGVPAFFPGRYFAELRALDPAKGAKPLLERYAENVEIFLVQDNTDIDTVDDYRRAIAG